MLSVEEDHHPFIHQAPKAEIEYGRIAHPPDERLVMLTVVKVLSDVPTSTIREPQMDTGSVQAHCHVWSVYGPTVQVLQGQHLCNEAETRITGVLGKAVVET